MEKNVAVMMPFGGGERAASRRAALEFLRIKYLIEKKVAVTANGGPNPVTYRVIAYNLNVGDIAADVINAIAEADILVGVLTEKNVNVIYELAVRNMLKDEMLLLVKGDADQLVPQYLRGWAHIQLDHFDAQDILEEMGTLARKAEPRIDLRSPIPPSLVEAVDKHDDNLRTRLEDALQQLESHTPKRPEYILNLAKYLDPGRMLLAWTTYYPYSVVRIRWAKKSSRTRYEPTDMDGPAVIYSANEEFLRLYNVAARLPSPDSPQALTGVDLIGGLESEKLVEENDLKAFNADNGRVTNEIVFGDGFAWSRVPLRLNGRHPIAQYRDTQHLPTMVGKRVIGDPMRPHTAYYLIVYIALEGETDPCTSHR
jgi:hypothetical protein